MYNLIINKLKNTFQNLDKKVIKIMKNGLKICFLILLSSIAMLITYLFFLHNNYIYQIGILIFELSLYLSADFVVSGLAVDTIAKQIT